MSTAECLSCGAEVQVNKPKMGQMVSCRECGEVLEVVWLNPIELDWPVDDEDELDYEDEEEYDDLDFEEDEDELYDDEEDQ